jgi:hypothetical protein
MSVLKNILALIGLLVLTAVVAAYLLLKPVISEFDPEFASAYEQFAG